MIRPPEYFMAEALREARKGLYSTHPNPRVGCVIARDDAILARGFHAVPGGPHAEIEALRRLPDGDARGCTVFVTLEPCAHTGKTPPCADALVAARPDRVVVAMQDPNPLVAGQGIERLRAAGIEVRVGVLEAEARRLNPGFIKRMERGRPWLSVKMASSLDGRTALANGLSQWITGDAARQDVQRLRARSSAVLSSARTVIDDDAALTVRLTPQQLGQDLPLRQPLRVIVDARAELTGSERLFSQPGEVLIVCGETT
jgi:diaminohydroxyphosphoribosylaminopyrimidine deaminase/5-amino-6-(5-phosphoribosylamino)uracil reductase